MPDPYGGFHGSPADAQLLMTLCLDRAPQEGAVLRLARAHRLSVYDAAYLELAQREGLPLATLDADLTELRIIE
jgi:predicted nucleic acid-binding protein